DAVSRLQSVLDTDPLAITCRALDVATGETLPANLDEDVRATRLQQDGGVWHRGQTLTFSLIQHRGPRLAHQQPTARIFDFELHRQRSRRRIDHAGIVDVMGLKHDRIAAARDLEPEAVDVTRHRGI